MKSFRKIVKKEINDLNRGLSGQSNEYVQFVRPMTGKLLRGLGLDVSYTGGDKDYLYTTIEGEERKILDLTGGYGANLLGHNNPELKKCAIDNINLNIPNHSQGSVRPGAIELGKKFDELIFKETGKKGWITHQSNSGAEAIEAAIKLCQIKFRQRQQLFLQEINESINYLQSPACDEPAKNPKQIEAYYNDVKEQVAQMSPVYFALEGGYHGKTLGALSLTSNSRFKSIFVTISGPREISQNQEKIQEVFAEESISVQLYCPKNNLWKSQKFSSVAGVFVEPIQGEGGVREVSGELLATLRDESKKWGALLVSDEIQTGVYRTGKLAAIHHHNVVPDIYTFSKTLGGGYAKIAATVINKNAYGDEFGYLHTSTFSEDEFSSRMGTKVLDVLDTHDFKATLEMASTFKNKLISLKEKYPEYIKDIRGRGLMLAIEINPELLPSFETKLFSDPKMLGYLISSTLLHKENIRISPTLSNPETLRIAPSIFFGEAEVSQVIAALDRFFMAVKNKKYSELFWGPFRQELNDKSVLPLKDVHSETAKKPFAVFLSHLIDPDHVKLFLGSTKNIESEILRQKIYDFSSIQEFSFYYRGNLKGSDGNEIEIALLSIPWTSEDMASLVLKKKSYQLVATVQRAIDYAKSQGATTVGLGQFTSIVTKNGLLLDNRGINLTTGNALTVALSVEAGIREYSKKFNSTAKTVACIGAAGNIMSVASEIIAEEADKIFLIHREPIDRSIKFKKMAIGFLNELLKVETSPLQKKLKDYLEKNNKEPKEISTFFDDPEFCSFIHFSNDLTLAKEADLVMVGSSAREPIIGKEHISENTVVVDIAVPPNVKDEVKTIGNTTVILGGVAQLPFNQSITSPVFPLPPGECFACMGETFTLALAGKENVKNIGDLVKGQVKDIHELSKNVGMNLGRAKRIKSL